MLDQTSILYGLIVGIIIAIGIIDKILYWDVIKELNKNFKGIAKEYGVDDINLVTLILLTHFDHRRRNLWIDMYFTDKLMLNEDLKSYVKTKKRIYFGTIGVILFIALYVIIT